MPTPQPTEVNFKDGHQTITKPTVQLRWSKSDQLQQAWEKITYDAMGRAIAGSFEWRDIPTEE